MVFSHILWRNFVEYRFQSRTSVAIAPQFDQTSQFSEGLTEEKISQLPNFENSEEFSEREKSALRYAALFKRGEEAIDSDEVYDGLREQFSEEEIIELGLFCAETDGVGKFVRSLNVLSWEDACQIDPSLEVRDQRTGTPAG